VNRRFLSFLKTVTGARNLLLLLDEADVLAGRFRVAFSLRDLSLFAEAVRVAEGLSEQVRHAWVERVNLLGNATTSDLQQPGWSFPYPSPECALSVQTAGLARDPNFRWIGEGLYAFARSRPDQRWKDARGKLVFIDRPYVADRVAIFAAWMPADYVSRQLGVKEVARPFAAVTCQHAGTEFFNVSSLIGAGSRFRNNHRQILDVFAQLIIRNIEARRLTLLISRKRFKPRCAAYLRRRLAGWGYPATIVLSDGEPPEQASPTTLPLIHYGIKGVNGFQHYHSAFCLNSYNIDEEVLREAVADVEDDALRFPVSIRVAGRPRRRVAGTFDRRFDSSDADRIARAYLEQLEAAVVLQAVGRVRYATLPRMVVTIQAGELPGVQLTREFSSLRELRAHFGLETGSQLDRLRQETEVLRLRSEGLTVAAIAERLGFSGGPEEGRRMRDDWWLPGWKEKVEAAARPLPPPMPSPSLSRSYLVDRIHFVQDPDQARDMVQAAYESPVSWIGIDTEYRFSHDQPVPLPNGEEWRDIRSIRPFCIAFAIVSGDRLLRFVVDLRVDGLRSAVQDVLDLPVPFAAHHARSELFVLGRSASASHPSCGTHSDHWFARPRVAVSARSTCRRSRSV
jgi:hypothetical protein